MRILRENHSNASNPAMPSLEGEKTFLAIDTVDSERIVTHLTIKYNGLLCPKVHTGKYRNREESNMDWTFLD